MVRDYRSVVATLQAQLGEAPTDVGVFEHRDGPSEYAYVSARGTKEHGTRKGVAMLIGENGATPEMWVMR